MRIFATLALCGLLTSCATTPTSNPQASVFQIKQNYELALQVAVAYDNLPPCVAGVKAVCSEHAVKVKLKTAKDVASPAIQAAENAVRDPTFSASASQAVVSAANQAVIALTAITAALAVSH
jgi:hypothetical protein